MPVTYRPPNVGTFLGDSGGGSSVADIILNGGQRQAQLLLEAGRQRAAAFEGIGSDLAGGLAAFGQARSENKVQKAVADASAPGADVESIFAGLDPSLQPRARKAYADWSEAIGKRKESDLRLAKLKQEMDETTKNRMQQTKNAIAMGAFHGTQFLDQPDGGLGYMKNFSQQAKVAGIEGADQYDEFIAGAEDAMKAAGNDPRAQATVADAVRQQSKAIYQKFMGLGDASVQEKFKPEVEKITTLNADGSETTELVPKQPGISRTGAPKPDARSLDVQRAEALARGDAPKAASLLEQIRKDAEARRDPNVAAARADAAAARETARNDTRSDKSYQFNSAELERTAKPLTDQAERFGRLVATVNQKTPQADALIAPELLTVMAGGSGSGLRMNEAEISRVLGGRTNLESVKAALNKWQIDPSKGLSITDAQRTQIQALIGDMNTRIQKKAAALDEARTALYNTEDPTEHRKIMADLKRKLADTGSDSGEPKLVNSPEEARKLPSGTVFRTPDGRLKRVP